MTKKITILWDKKAVFFTVRIGKKTKTGRMDTSMAKGTIAIYDILAKQIFDKPAPGRVGKVRLC